MGLDTSHDCWHGPYGQFMQWRCWLASQVGIPLLLMDGFYDWEWEEGDLNFDSHYASISAVDSSDYKRGQMHWDTLSGYRQLGRPISWGMLEGTAIGKLLHHSDCNGRIRWWDCRKLAIELGRILRKADDDTREIHTWKDWRDGRGCYDGFVPATKRFIAGCLRAYREREDVIFR